MIIGKEKFGTHREKGLLHLIAELSDLGPNPFHQVYPDACDEGITVQGNSDKVDYVVAHIERNRENEVVSYDLIPTSDSIRRVPACRNTRVTLFND